MAKKKAEILFVSAFFNSCYETRQLYLEPDNRAKCRLQIVVRVVVEIHLVADIQTQSNRPEMPFKTATGIESPRHVVFAQTGDRTREGSKCRRRIIQAEIDEPAFSGNEWLNGVSTQVDARPKQAMNYPQIGTLDRYRPGGIVDEAFGERPAEVVGHFSLKLQTLVGHERRAAADAKQVRVGLGQSEIIGENPYLHMLVLLSE